MISSTSVAAAAYSALFVLLSLLSSAPTAGAIYIEKPDDGNNRIDQDRDLATSTSSSKTYLVTFTDKSISPSKRCEALAKSNGGSVVHVYDTVLNGCALAVPVTQAVQAQATFTALSSNPVVENVELDQRMYALATPSTSWGLDRIDQCSLPLNNQMTKQDASGVTMFIVDTGIMNTHVELASSMSTDDCHASMIDGEPAFSDGNGHGTHVAGTTCGANYGVSANCKLCAVKVLSNAGSGSTAGVIAGIDHVANKCSSTPGMKCVANLSLGGGYSQQLNDAIAAAVNKGVVMVVAAGNESSDACGVSPASEPLAITVGSTTNTDAQSSFSNWGSCVDVYAPGSSITSSWNTSPIATNTLSGTSMASPHVAGIAAAIRSANPSWNPTQVRNAIVNNSVSLPFGRTLATIDDIVGCPTPMPTTMAPTTPPTPCPNGGVNLEVKLKTDSYATETAWTLTNKCGSGTVITSPAYTAGNTMHSNMYCVPNGSYDFRITDTYGDGICCSWGSGSYEVIMGGVSAINGGTFLQSETKTFGTCAGLPPTTPNPTRIPTLAPTLSPTTLSPTALPTPPPTPCPNGAMNVEVKLKTDNYATETAWTLTNKCGSGTIITSPPYIAGNTMFNHQYCIADGAYDFRITDTFGDGLCCAWGLGSYEVVMNGVSVVTGGAFLRDETKTFGACAEVPTPTTSNPVASPVTAEPSSSPTDPPTSSPSLNPTSVPTVQPTTMAPTNEPTFPPTSLSPTSKPTSNPTSLPPMTPVTTKPTTRPPTRKPTTPTRKPTRAPTRAPTRTPTQPPGSPCIGTSIEIRIVTDTYPTETSWKLTNQCGTGTIVSSPQYTSPGVLHTTYNCLPNGLYDFTITDTFGDGICCAWGTGSYGVYVNGTLAHSGGSFAYAETKTIGACV